MTFIASISYRSVPVPSQSVTLLAGVREVTVEARSLQSAMIKTYNELDRTGQFKITKDSTTFIAYEITLRESK